MEKKCSAEAEALESKLDDRHTKAIDRLTSKLTKNNQDEQA
jgi:hypothetical protein